MDIGKLHYFLGVSVQQSPDSGKTWVGQPAYIQNILKKFGFEYFKLYQMGSKLEKPTDES